VGKSCRVMGYKWQHNSWRVPIISLFLRFVCDLIWWVHCHQNNSCILENGGILCRGAR
jgi:hypothetical protein